MRADDEYGGWSSFHSNWDPDGYRSAGSDCSHLSAPQWKYDVFLSFRGEDTRTSFTDHLYEKLVWRGIRTFRDDPDIARGSTISKELSKAIQFSRFAIIVLSPNYASSTWCLDELSMIIYAIRTSRRFPVFYHVDPSDVRRQTGPFAEAFAKHEHDFKADPKKVYWWRQALISVSQVAGWTASKYRYESELIKEIVDVIWEKVYPTFKLLDSTQNLFGIDFKLEYIDLLLYTSISDVRFLGIWGMGGVGKTTIARLVYERISHQFEVSCFLANVRQQSTAHGIVHLQKQLISLVMKEKFTQVCDAYSGAAIIKNLLCNKKVLLVLDDVDQLNQLEMFAGSNEWFGLGSRIIITTRDGRVLIEHGIEKLYELQGLDNNQALQLFIWKAFKQYHPAEDYLDLSKCFVDYAGGLPLALITLGSSLYNRDRNAWISALDILKKAPNKTIFETLKISYDGLNDMEKRIFLDVACFHRGAYKERVIEILDSCGFPVRIVIDVLVEKSLLTIFDDHVMMHDLIQEMGREIVRQESYEEPGRRSRLWHDKDIFHVFSKNTHLGNLKYIDLSFSENLIKTPDFTGIPNLEKLVLESCTNVVEIHPSIAFLKKLKILNFTNCKSIRSLPREVQMESLEVFILSGCSKLKSIPEFLGPMKNLSVLSLDGTAIEEAPSSMECLIGLISLDLRDCKSLLCLPSVCSMKSLKSLNMSRCSKLVKFPDSARQIECLKELDLSETALSELPSSIFLMKNLKVLSFRGCKGPPPKSWHLFPPFGSFQRQSPEPAGLVMASLDKLHSMKKLDLSNCSFGEGAIPNDIGYMSSLEELNLGGNNFVSLPASIRWLSQLILLDLEGCKKLRRLPDLPSNEELTVITDDCTSLEMLPDPPKLSRLRWFSFRCVNCYTLVGSEGSNSRPFFNVKAIPAAEGNPAAVELDCLRTHACGIKCFSKVDGSLSTSLLVKGLFQHKVGQVLSDHLWLLYSSFKDYDPKNYWKGKFYEIEFSFKTFCSMENNKCLKLKKCGIRVVVEQDVVDLKKTMNLSNRMFSPMNDLRCDLEQSTRVQCTEVEKILEHSDNAGPSGRGISDMKFLSNRLKHD
ncbi:hypothetical protein ACLB2K_029935 [Fragaria x ananassa]